MSIIKCPKCEAAISDVATKCPHCGKIIKKHGSKLLTVGTYMTWIGVLGVAIWIFLPKESKGVAIYSIFAFLSLFSGAILFSMGKTENNEYLAERQAELAEQSKRAKEQANEITMQQAHFTPSITLNDNFAVDESNQKVFILGRVMPYIGITGVQTLYSSTTTTTKDGDNRMGRAVVGGLLFGAAGAIVGASTGNSGTQITNRVPCGVRVYYSDVQHPYDVLTAKDGFTEYERIYGILQAIIAQNQQRH